MSAPSGTAMRPMSRRRRLSSTRARQALAVSGSSVLSDRLNFWRW